MHIQWENVVTPRQKSRKEPRNVLDACMGMRAPRCITLIGNQHRLHAEFEGDAQVDLAIVEEDRALRVNMVACQQHIIGSALWFAAANQEYQSLSLTWLVHQPWLIALLTHITVFWETFYPVLIWPRLTRPIFLALAVAVHGGIAIFLGMKTFGLAMIFGNMAFVEPETVEYLVNLFRGTPQQNSPQSAEIAPRAAGKEATRESNRYTVSI